MNPDSRIIIMVREPIAQIQSFYKEHYSGTQGETAGTLTKALKLEIKRKNWEAIPSVVRFPSLLFYMQRARYSFYIQRFLQNFNNVKIILFDDFRDATEQTFSSILEFLELPSVHIDPKTTNPSIEKVYFKYARFTKPFFHFLNPMLAKLPSEFTEGTLRLLSDGNIETRAKLDDQFYHDLKKSLSEEVASLSKLVRRDLKALWDY